MKEPGLRAAAHMAWTKEAVWVSLVTPSVVARDWLDCRPGVQKACESGQVKQLQMTHHRCLARSWTLQSHLKVKLKVALRLLTTLA